MSLTQYNQETDDIPAFAHNAPPKQGRSSEDLRREEREQAEADRKAERERLQREREAVARIDGEPAPDPEPEPHTQRPATDLGNAERLVDRFGGIVRWCPDWGAWLVWDGKRWARDGKGRVLHYAHKVARGIYREAQEAETEGARKALASWAVQSENRNRQQSMLELAKGIPDLVAEACELDADIWALNTLSGIVDLRTGELRPHKPEEMHTKLAPVLYDPDATSERFDSFLHKIFNGDAELQKYVQRLVGVFLSGDISEQIFPVFWGSGANGKSVLMDIVLHVMGDYAAIAPESLVTADHHREHPTEIADLQGRRFVAATETEEGKKLRVGLVKRMTGDATLKGRFMRQDFFEFQRTHKTALVTNHRPGVSETKNAIWRRLHLVPFTVTIPLDQQDKQLFDKLKVEASAVLAWAVRGCMDWREHGLNPPAIVKQATEDYRSEADPLGDFLGDCCVVSGDEAHTATRKDIRTRYVQWAKELGDRDPLPAQGLYDRLRELQDVQEGYVTAPDGKRSRGFRGLYIHHAPTGDYADVAD